MKYSLALAAALGLSAGAAFAQDAEEGKNILAGRGQQGPNLYGLPGRQAGSVEDFDLYGEDLVAAGEAGLEWNEEDFLVYVEDPRGFLQEYLDNNRARSKMSYRLRNGGADVWAYLESVSPEPES